jgi:FK506-binding protein 2
MRRFATLPLYALLAALVSVSATPQKLDIEVTKAVDCSRKTRNGDKISVHYNGTLQSDGTQFDSSHKGGVPFTFALGEGYVISGWDQGLLDMCIGERRKLTIPPELAYGEYGSGPIPGDSTLSKWLIELTWARNGCVWLLMQMCSLRDRAYGY